MLQGLRGVIVMNPLFSGYLHFHHCAAPLCALLPRPPSTSSGVADKKNESEEIEVTVAQCEQELSDSH